MTSAREKLKCPVLWDTENDEEAINWDGSQPEVIGDIVYIKVISCNCNPASGSICGSCVDYIEEHKIGYRYQWTKEQPMTSARSEG